MKEEKIIEENKTEKQPKKHSLLKKIILFSVIGLILLFCYSYIWIHKFITITETAIIEEKLNPNWNGFKIVQFTDIHFGKTTNEKEIEKMVNQINLTKGDIVVFTGDLFDNSINLSDKNIDFLKSSLKKINAKLMKLAIRGDSDYKNIELFNEIMNETGFKILENENVLIFDNGINPIQISGISSIQNQEYNLQKTLETTEQNINYKILLAHEPEILNEINTKEIDLILSGHSLGGLIDIPYLGGLIDKPKTGKYTKGKYEKDDTIMYVSSGIGTENLSLRFNNTPTINLYRFYNYD